MSYYDCEEIADLEKEILALKHERESLLRKLKGVRAARVRDLAKADERLRKEIVSSSGIIQSLLDKKTKTQVDRLNFVFWHLSNYLVESGKITQSEWEGLYLAALNEYARKHKQGEPK